MADGSDRVKRNIDAMMMDGNDCVVSVDLDIAALKAIVSVRLIDGNVRTREVRESEKTAAWCGGREDLLDCAALLALGELGVDILSIDMKWALRDLGTAA